MNPSEELCATCGHIKGLHIPSSISACYHRRERVLEFRNDGFLEQESGNAFDCNCSRYVAPRTPFPIAIVDAMQSHLNGWMSKEQLSHADVTYSLEHVYHELKAFFKGQP